MLIFSVLRCAPRRFEDTRQVRAGRIFSVSFGIGRRTVPLRNAQNRGGDYTDFTKILLVLPLQSCYGNSTKYYDSRNTSDIVRQS